MQVEMFSSPEESVSSLIVPKFTESEATMNFKSYLQEGGHFKSMDDEREIWVYECTLPESSGVKQRVTGGDKVTVTYIPFRISSTNMHYNEGTLINEWLKMPENKGTPAANWIIENSEELNKARRYWHAVRLERELENTVVRFSEMADTMRRKRIALSIAIFEAREGRRLDREERLLKAKEYGATEEDLAH